MPTEGLTVAWTGEDSRRHRLRFVPMSIDGAYTRVEEARTADGWRVVGEELVVDVECEVDADCEALEVVA